MHVLNRRVVLTGAAAAAALSASSRTLLAQNESKTPTSAPAPFVLPPLAYAIDALEKSIDALTMQLHHDRHHAAYVNNLNEAAKTAPEIASRPIEQVIAGLHDLPDAVRTTVRNNMGGHVNHTMFWQIMGPNGAKPDGDVLAAIDRDLGGLDGLKANFNAAGSRVFGSGWVFVTVTSEGRLAIESRPNQDSPLMDGKRVLFGNDIWEHSYYIKYQNRRSDYLKAWWDIVNWTKIAERYADAKKGTLTI